MWVRFPPGPFPPGRLWRASSQRSGPSRLVLLALLSAAIHLSVLLLLLLRRPGEPELSPPPADIAMVFESGSPKASAAPEPSPAARPSTPQPARPLPAPAATPRQAPVPAQPPAVPPPPLPATAQPHAAPPKPAAPAPVAVKPPPAPQPIVRLRPPEAIAPPAMPKRAEPRPAPPVPAHSIARPPAPALRPPPHPSRQAASRFPAPIMRNFFIPSATSAAMHPFLPSFESGTPAARRGRHEDNPYDMRGAEELGSDWSQAFMAWVDEHKHYPEQAIANDEDGNSTVQFTVDHYGRVREVSLIRRSGSVWLDMGLTGLFRDARLPPFPPDAPEKDVTITFTMHYVLTH